MHRDHSRASHPQDSLADYPVADDMDYSQEQMMEDWDDEQTDKA